MARRMLGRYIVADDAICHGKPTFVGTRIMVWQVLELVAQGMDWEEIRLGWPSEIPREAIVEAISLASRAFNEHADEYTLEPLSA